VNASSFIALSAAFFAFTQLQPLTNLRAESTGRVHLLHASDLDSELLSELHNAEPLAPACLARRIPSGTVTLVTEAGDLCAR